MIPLLSLLLFATAQPAAESHDRLNPLFHELHTAGVAIGAGHKTVLPPPFMPDNLDAQAQQALIKGLPGRRVAVKELFRKAVFAPHVHQIRDIKPSDPQAPAYSTDVWFIAYGDLKALAKRDPNSFFKAGTVDVETHILTPAELAKRKIPVAPQGGPLTERYVFTTYPVLDRVKLSVTTRTLASQTADSMLLATRLDPRFANDPKFPNQWRQILRNQAGNVIGNGPANGYDCTVMYTKITQLAEPKGALFVESHRVSTEPKGWFGGKNLLRSKLPFVIKDEVESFRKEARKTLTAE